MLVLFFQKWTTATHANMGHNRVITTTNGVESLHHSLKEFHLRAKGLGTVSSLAEVLVTSYVPSLMKKYRDVNHQAGSAYKRYHESVPLYMRDRPHPVIRHMLKRMARVQDFTAQHIIRPVGEQTGMFAVRSQAGDVYYLVSFGSLTEAPQCSCHDFLRYFLPCKHFLAVFEFTDFGWDDLPAHYLESPYLNLDFDILSYEPTDLCPASIPASLARQQSAPSSRNTATASPTSSQVPPSPPVSAPTQSPHQETAATPSYPSVSAETPVPDLEKKRKSIRHMLKRIEDEVLLVDDEPILTEVQHRLQNTLDLLPFIPFRKHNEQKKTTCLRRRGLPVKRKRGRTSGQGELFHINRVPTLFFW